MLDPHSWSKSAVVAFFSVSAALGGGGTDPALQPVEEPQRTSVAVQFAYEPAAQVDLTEGPSITRFLTSEERVKDTDPSWMLLLKEDHELWDMAYCESRYKPTAVNHGDAEITGYASYGLFQYQPGTFERYVRHYGLLADVPDDRLHEHYFDPYIQIELTKLVLADGGGRNWYNCYYTKYGTGAHRATGD